MITLIPSMGKDEKELTNDWIALDSSTGNLIDRDVSLLELRYRVKKTKRAATYTKHWAHPNVCKK